MARGRGGVLVTNPSLRWDKPSGGGNTFDRRAQFLGLEKWFVDVPWCTEAGQLFWGFRVLGGKLGLRPSSQDFRRHGSDVQRAEVQ